MTSMHTPRILKVFLAVSFLLASATDVKASGRYGKKEAEVTATQTWMTRPANKVSVDVPASRDKELRDGEPALTVSDDEIALLEKLASMTSENDPEKPDLLFRLAELYAERARYYGLRARALDEPIARGCGRAGVSRDH